MYDFPRAGRPTMTMRSLVSIVLQSPSGDALDRVSPGTSNAADGFLRKEELVVVGVSGVPQGVEAMLTMEESDAYDEFLLTVLLLKLGYI